MNGRSARETVNVRPATNATDPTLIRDGATSPGMPDDTDDLERRLAAVERAVDGDAASTTAPQDAVDRERLEQRLDDLEARVDELDAALQAVRGFLGGVSAVNESVERRADAAVAAVERLESEIDGEGEDDRPDTEVDADELSHVDDDTVRETDTDRDPESSPDDGLRERLRGLR